MSRRSSFTPPEERNLNQFRGRNFKEVIEYFEGQEFSDQIPVEIERDSYPESSIMDGFLDLLRAKGVRVSTPEWLQFIRVIENKTTSKELKKLVSTGELLNKLRIFAQTVLVKDKTDEAAFHEAFDEYFELAARVYAQELETMKQKEQPQVKKDRISAQLPPEKKEQLGIKDVAEDLEQPESKHEDKEQVHGGKQDQHNDILRKADLTKEGGGSKKDIPGGEGDKNFPSIENDGDDNNPDILDSATQEQKQSQENGFLVGGGKGKTIFAERIVREPILHLGDDLSKEIIEKREEVVGRIDRRKRYETRPTKATIREVIRGLRKIILDVSEVKSQDVNISRTVENFAKRRFRFDYEKEREKQPEILLLIDTGGPVDEWSPLMKEVAEEMARGLTKLEVYLFHNNLYGYVWKPDPENLLASSYANPNSLIDIKAIVKKRKKVIIYGDAEMSYSEFEEDGWPPSDNDEKIKRFGMSGGKCLEFIKRKAGSVVWISPVFKQEWERRDDSGSINAVGGIIPMHDLTVGGVEDAVKSLMKR